MKAPALALIFAFALAIGIVVFRFSRSSPRGRDLVNKLSSYTVVPMGQEEALPGKIVSVKMNGAKVASYKCSPDDACVVWFGLQSSSGTYINDKELTADVETESKQSVLLRSSIENKCLLRRTFYGSSPASWNAAIYVAVIPKGYLTSPKFLHIHGTDNQVFQSSSIPITNVAPASHVLKLPPPGVIRANEKVAVVNWPKGSRYTEVSLQSPPKSEQGYVQCLVKETSNQGQDTIPLLQSFDRGKVLRVEIPYVDQISALNLELDHFERKRANFTLVYRNAIIGQKLDLQFPATQLVGQASGVPISFLKTGEGFLLSPIQSPHGDIYLRLTPDKAGQKYRRAYTFHLIKVSPKPEELGLRLYRLNMEQNNIASSFSAEVHAPTKATLPPGVKTVPELHVTMSCDYDELVSHQTLILPIHQTAAKPLSKTVSLLGIRETFQTGTHIRRRQAPEGTGR